MRSDRYTASSAATIRAAADATEQLHVWINCHRAPIVFGICGGVDHTDVWVVCSQGRVPLPVSLPYEPIERHGDIEVYRPPSGAERVLRGLSILSNGHAELPFVYERMYFNAPPNVIP